MPPRSFFAAPALVIALALGSCRTEVGEAPREQSPRTASSPIDSGTSPEEQAVTGRTDEAIASVAHGAIDTTVRAFLEAVATGNQQQFAGLLSARSNAFIRDVGAAKEVFSAAREALGSLGDVRSTLIGGDADSVAVLLRAQPASMGEAPDGELIVILLNEAGQWKLMYPGLLRPGADFRR